MNGIIHPCTHGDGGSVVRLTEDQMFLAVGNFVDNLMAIVKPQKLLFLAVDGDRIHTTPLARLFSAFSHHSHMIFGRGKRHAEARSVPLTQHSRRRILRVQSSDIDVCCATSFCVYMLHVRLRFLNVHVMICKQNRDKICLNQTRVLVRNVNTCIHVCVCVNVHNRDKICLTRTRVLVRIVRYMCIYMHRCVCERENVHVCVCLHTYTHRCMHAWVTEECMDV
jgi:hypothetical protein